MKKTKILATIGPASNSLSAIAKMRKAGMDAFRINTAYGDITRHETLIQKVWSKADIPAVLDLKGPEIRIKTLLPQQSKKGDIVDVSLLPGKGLSFNRNLKGKLDEGDRIILDKGNALAKVIHTSPKRATLRMLTDCLFRNGIGVNMPGKQLDIPTLSAQDRKAIKMAGDIGVDYLALSFTRNASDVKCLRKRIRGTDMGIISKIEEQGGIDDLDGIIRLSEGVMIARGDLGIEIPYQRIPLIQKDIINRCNRLGKISIVATEMLHSMVENPIPTRAETSDVANAIIDGADCVMLSAESAAGKYPSESVKAMADIACAVETKHPAKSLDERAHDMVSLAISKAVTSIIDTLDVDKIVVLTHTGHTAMLISNFRIMTDIIAVTADERVRRRLEMVHSVTPIMDPGFGDCDRIPKIALYCLEKGHVSKKDMVLFTAGTYSKSPVTNLVELHSIGELLRYEREKSDESQGAVYL